MSSICICSLGEYSIDIVNHINTAIKVASHTLHQRETSYKENNRGICLWNKKNTCFTMNISSKINKVYVL